MQTPRATYRLQFTPSFTFRHAQEIVSYLSELGISHLYASPVFKSKKGSTHGYDVLDPNELNPELGSQDDFKKLMEEVERLGMSWVQDIVPNHMAYDSENRMLMDVLENGSSSRYFDFFDIEWNHPYQGIHGKVLAPFLGKLYGEALESGEIALQYGEEGFTLNYYQSKFPLTLSSYQNVLTLNFSALRRKLGRQHPDMIKFFGVLYVLRSLPAEEERQDLQNQIAFVKRMLWELYGQNEIIHSFIDENIAYFNGAKGNPESFTHLDNLHLAQLYKLAFWKVATAEINYRRFFSINDLISLRVEREQVFDHTHAYSLGKIRDGTWSGLRIDHIDGLYDPLQYLQRLRKNAPDTYIVVEKILDIEEELPKEWPIQGTTGYEFMNYTNGIFCDRRNQVPFEKLYYKFTNFRASFRQLIADKKRAIIGRQMAGDIDYLAHLIKNISSKDRHGADITLHGLRRALVEVLALFPVYRTYVSPEHFSDSDRTYIQDAIHWAKQTNPQSFYELDFIERFMMLRYDEKLPESEREKWRHFVMRLQQFTGPLMAKGFEDTLMYVYNELISLNEVGGSPKRFGIAPVEYHHFLRKRAANWPLALNATSTHDTKRGEDVRTRIDVLSEIPDEWERRMSVWHSMNADCKREVDGEQAPTANDEYLLYQTLIGTFPLDGKVTDDYSTRIKEYMVKALREGKVNSDWLKINEPYEQATIAFINALLMDSTENQFLADFIPFQQRIAFYGALNSLSQVILKATAPGVPDFYQGCEFWDLSLVDPDNRRSVDYQARRLALYYVRQRETTDQAGLISELSGDITHFHTKLYIIYRALCLRKAQPALFEAGEYIPLKISGEQQEHVFGFFRKKDSVWSLTIIPRLLTSIVEPGTLPLGNEVWKDTTIELPEDAPASWRNEITRTVIRTQHGRVFIGELLYDFPAAIFLSR